MALALVRGPRGLLLARRATPPGSGLYCLPGGKRQPGEGLAQTCRRELREELGAEVGVLGLALFVLQEVSGPDCPLSGPWPLGLFWCELPEEAALPPETVWLRPEELQREDVQATDRVMMQDALAHPGLAPFRTSVAVWSGGALEVVRYG